MINQERLKEVLNYNPDTGVFTWKVSPRNHNCKGKVAGSIGKPGYVRIAIDKVKYAAHRLAFLYMTGSVPEYVDHINGDPSDNRWYNLRQATPSQNQRNKSLSKNNKSGVKGVCWVESRGKYCTYMKVDGKNMYFGSYSLLEEAKLAVEQARLKYHKGFANHG